MPLPERPADLPQALHPIWDRTITQLQAAGTQRVDPAALTAYCSAVHSHQGATQLVAASGPLIVKDGNPVANPAIAVQRDTSQVIRNLGRAMGLTRTAAPTPDMNPGAHMNAGHLGRWCDEHGRWECTHNRTKGRGQCHAVEKLGTGGCHKHAGSNQDVKQAAALLVRRVPTLGAGQLRDVSPGQALLEEVARTAQEVEWLATLVGGMDEGDVVWGRERERVSSVGEWPGTEVLSSAKPSVWVTLYHQQRRHLAAVCAEALRANVDERMVRVAEAQGAAIVQVLHAVFDDPQLGLLPEQRAVLGQVVPRHLRALTA